MFHLRWHILSDEQRSGLDPTAQLADALTPERYNLSRSSGRVAATQSLPSIGCSR